MKKTYSKPRSITIEIEEEALMSGSNGEINIGSDGNAGIGGASGSEDSGGQFNSNNYRSNLWGD